jgi:hypothetical protein
MKKHSIDNMKRTMFCFIFTCSFFIASAQDGSVQQGTNNIGFMIRLGIYNTVATDKSNTTSVSNQSNGRAGDANYALSYDRGLNDRLTVGGQFRYDGYILGKDTSATQLNVAWGVDIDADAAYHFVRSQHTDLYVQELVGYTYIKLADDNLNYQGVYTASGLAYGLELGARFYFGNHFGIHLNFGYSGYDYPSGTAASVGGYTQNISLFFSGSTYGIGLCYKF